MSQASRIAVAAAAAALLFSGGSAALAKSARFPVTVCGPDEQYLCNIRGFFDLAPYKYSVALSPKCIQTVRVETPTGAAYRQALVCDWPIRPMLMW